MYSPFTKITYIPLCLFGTASQSYLMCCLLGYSPLFAPSKTFNFHVVHFWKSAPWTYFFMHSSPNNFTTWLQWDSHEDKSRPWNVRGSALALCSPGVWKHPLWTTRLHPFTGECSNSSTTFNLESHELMMEKATEQKVPVSPNHSFISVGQSCPTFCNPMDCSTSGLPVHHQLPELAQTHVHWVGDAIQPSHLLPPTSPFAFSLSQHQGLF